MNSIATQRLSSEDELFLIERYGGMLRHLVIEIIESDYSREMAVYKEALARRLGAALPWTISAADTTGRRPCWTTTLTS